MPRPEIGPGGWGPGPYPIPGVDGVWLWSDFHQDWVFIPHDAQYDVYPDGG